MRKINQIVWVISGLLLITVLSLTLSALIAFKIATEEVGELLSQVTIEDVRKGLDLIDKDLENKQLALELEEKLSLRPLPDTPETWEAFLDFCGRTGYVSTNPDNYLRFRYGKLKP